MSDTECIHEMPTSQCGYCKPKPPAQSWPAKYEGICRVCQRVIDVGEMVVWNVDQTGVQHAGHRSQ